MCSLKYAVNVELFLELATNLHGIDRNTAHTATTGTKTRDNEKAIKGASRLTLAVAPQILAGYQMCRNYMLLRTCGLTGPLFVPRRIKTGMIRRRLCIGTCARRTYFCRYRNWHHTTLMRTIKPPLSKDVEMAISNQYCISDFASPVDDAQSNACCPRAISNSLDLTYTGARSASSSI